MTDRGVKDKPTLTADVTSLRSIGLAYRQLSAALAAEWARVCALDGPHFAQASISGMAEGLEALQTWERWGRRIHGATACINGKVCPAEWVRNCDVCTEAKS